jgi:lipopolysaccharide transport system ATP-binding protein
MSTVIEVENLFKQYRLGQVSTGSIAHDLNRWWHTVRGKEDPYEKITGVNNREDGGSNDYVWALQDINFSVKQGEVLGIIGRNGAGKSTLLKILSKVTSPTKGNIKVKGRIASLLEVGTGFHPELTGRENIFLNGAILGMTKSEIRSKFDEIVAFSGVEKYIDTPVKRYSSGMYVRLAFAVAAHLEPEILIVDEVLAVGDAEFQKKCLGKMKDVSGEGRTVLFVSHNLDAVRSLCANSILLSKGKIEKIDFSSIIIDHYLLKNKSDNSEFSIDKSLSTTHISNAKIMNSNPNSICDSDEINIKLTFNILNEDLKFTLGIGLQDASSVRIMTDYIYLEEIFKSKNQKEELIISIPKNLLAPKSYSLILTLFTASNQFHQFIDEVCYFTVINTSSKFSSFVNLDLGAIQNKFRLYVQ